MLISFVSPPVPCSIYTHLFCLVFAETFFILMLMSCSKTKSCLLILPCLSCLPVCFVPASCLFCRVLVYLACISAKFEEAQYNIVMIGGAPEVPARRTC
ncbi:hypothetical protein GOODEAATRI_024064 [Goodea atripinnis]|uniref:Uncharacterized protein n=1 Tax=Goodea atripinnis TaxID=208336 RepID=A0ABV0PGJ8_9TELE